MKKNGLIVVDLFNGENCFNANMQEYWSESIGYIGSNDRESIVRWFMYALMRGVVKCVYDDGYDYTVYTVHLPDDTKTIISLEVKKNKKNFFLTKYIMEVVKFSDDNEKCNEFKKSYSVSNYAGGRILDILTKGEDHEDYIMMLSEDMFNDIHKYGLDSKE